MMLVDQLHNLINLSRSYISNDRGRKCVHKLLRVLVATHGAFAILPRTVSKAHLVIDMLDGLVRFMVAKTNRTTIACFGNLCPRDILKLHEHFSSDASSPQPRVPYKVGK